MVVVLCVVDVVVVVIDGRSAAAHALLALGRADRERERVSGVKYPHNGCGNTRKNRTASM